MTWSAPSDRTKADLLGPADPGHLAPERLGDLDRERTHVARCPVDQHPIAGLGRTAIADAEGLEREDRRMGERGRILEGHPTRDRLERLLAHADVLGERTLAEVEEVGEHLVAGLEPGHIRPDGGHDPGDVDADPRVLRPAQAQEQARELRPRRDPVEVGPVDRCGPDLDEHPVLRRDRPVDLDDAHDIGRAIAMADGGLHVSALEFELFWGFDIGGGAPSTLMVARHPGLAASPGSWPRVRWLRPDPLAGEARRRR